MKKKNIFPLIKMEPDINNNDLRKEELQDGSVFVSRENLKMYVTFEGNFFEVISTLKI